MASVSAAPTDETLVAAFVRRARDERRGGWTAGRAPFGGSRADGPPAGRAHIRRGARTGQERRSGATHCSILRCPPHWLKPEPEEDVHGNGIRHEAHGMRDLLH